VNPMTADQWLGAFASVGGGLAVALVGLLLAYVWVSEARKNLRAWRLARKDYGYREG
jgi:hypothetical protein